MATRITGPFSFWSENPIQIKFDAPLDNAKSKFDSIVVVSSDISKISPPETSFLKSFLELLKNQKQNDSAFEDVETFLSPNISEYQSIKKLVYSPTGPLNRHYDDVRRFMEAADKGIKRVLKAGAKRPILAVLYQNPNNEISLKYQHYDIASALGAAEAVYVPLEIREDVPDKASKIEALGYTGIGSMQLSVLSGIELGRIMCRDIGGSDPERMAAPNVATYVKELFVNTPIQVEVIEDQAVIEKEYPLLAAVNRAAKGVKRHNARVIFLTYEPEGPCEKTVVLVGKGVTYDTGGADIKAGGVMAGMHRDKCGAAAVAGFLQTVAELKPKGVRVLGAMSMVRNSVGSECYVSDELITSRAGVRVRVGNTDAEGRMAMADVLCHMKEKVIKDNCPDPYIFTIATLTGHAALAVGDGYSIIMENGPAALDNVGRKLQSAGHVIGDMFEVSTIRREDYEHHKGKSEYEHVLQCNNAPSSRTPRGHQSPAAFIILTTGLDKHDVNSQIPLKYSHIDIAGSSGPFPGIPTGSPIPALTANFLLNL
ncbi:putative aminopeptidase W07G4.4 [Caerostris darwini]|uniref:Aminopeptidase W07G4.4 n=1 Tax=Caerostris darwini TaxID=1538125 RepID=A0AAV4RLT4_9ARAC|nr:putative aminopeptidase W07G4.4 [Caerostris darwini]